MRRRKPSWKDEKRLGWIFSEGAWRPEPSSRTSTKVPVKSSTESASSKLARDVHCKAEPYLEIAMGPGHPRDPEARHGRLKESAAEATVRVEGPTQRSPHPALGDIGQDWSLQVP